MSDATPLQKLALIAGADDMDGETSLHVALSGRDERRASQLWYEAAHVPPPLGGHMDDSAVHHGDKGDSTRQRRLSATIEDIQQEVTSELRRLSRSGDVGNHSISSTSSKRISRAHIGAFAQEVYGDVSPEKGMNMDDIVAQREKSILREGALEAKIVAQTRNASSTRRSLPHREEERQDLYGAGGQLPPARAYMGRSASLGAVSVHTDVSSMPDDRALLLGHYTDGFGTSDDRANVLLRNKIRSNSKLGVGDVMLPKSGGSSSRSGLRSISSSKSPRRRELNQFAETQQSPPQTAAAPEVHTPTVLAESSPSPKQLPLSNSPRKARRSYFEKKESKEAALRSRRARTIYDRRSAQDQIVTPSPITVKGLGYAIRALDASDMDGGGWRCGRCSERTCGGFCHNCGAQCILVMKSAESRPVGLSPAAP